METAVGWSTVMVSEVSDSGDEGGREGGGGKGDGEVIAVVGGALVLLAHCCLLALGLALLLRSGC